MRNNLLVGGMLACALAAAPASAAAQIGLPLQLGASGGAAFPMGDLGEDDAFDTGWGFELNAVLQVAPAVGIYAAYDRYVFPFSDDIGLGVGEVTGDLLDHGFAGGLMLAVPGAGLGLSPWLRGGAIYNSARFSYDDSETTSESDSALGWEAGGGLDFPLGFVVSVTPSVRYRTYTPDFGGSGDFNVSYILGELGLTFRF